MIATSPASRFVLYSLFTLLIFQQQLCNEPICEYCATDPVAPNAANEGGRAGCREPSGPPQRTTQHPNELLCGSTAAGSARNSRRSILFCLALTLFLIGVLEEIEEAR